MTDQTKTQERANGKQSLKIRIPRLNKAPGPEQPLPTIRVKVPKRAAEDNGRNQEPNKALRSEGQTSPLNSRTGERASMEQGAQSHIENVDMFQTEEQQHDDVAEREPQVTTSDSSSPFQAAYESAPAGVAEDSSAGVDFDPHEQNERTVDTSTTSDVAAEEFASLSRTINLETGSYQQSHQNSDIDEAPHTPDKGVSVADIHAKRDIENTAVSPTQDKILSGKDAEEKMSSSSDSDRSAAEFYRNELPWLLERARHERSIMSDELASDAHIPSTYSPTAPSISETSPVSNSPPPLSQLKKDALDERLWLPDKQSDEEELIPVMQEGLQDPELKATYHDLPYLRFAELLPVKKYSAHVRAKTATELPGFYAMDIWRNLLMDRPLALGRIKDALTFKAKAIYFNPSRADPKTVRVGVMNNARYIVNPSNLRSCLIGVTTGCCLSSNLILGRTRRGRAGGPDVVTKNIELVPHTQEYERLAAFLGTVFDFESLKAPCYTDCVLTFSTRTATVDENVQETSSAIRTYLSNNLTSRFKRKAIPASGKEAEQFIETSLGATDEVRIYDGRNHEFSLQSDITDVHRLPLYKHGREDIPDGASVTVAYTTGLYKAKNNPKEELLSLNVRWVIIWAIPNISSLGRYS